MQDQWLPAQVPIGGHGAGQVLEPSPHVPLPWLPDLGSTVGGGGCLGGPLATPASSTVLALINLGVGSARAVGGSCDLYFFVLQTPVAWSDVAGTSLKGLNHHGNPRIPQPLGLPAGGTLADGVLHSQHPPPQHAEELIWEWGERRGCSAKSCGVTDGAPMETNTYKWLWHFPKCHPGCSAKRRVPSPTELAEELRDDSGCGRCCRGSPGLGERLSRPDGTHRMGAPAGTTGPTAPLAIGQSARRELGKANHSDPSQIPSSIVFIPLSRSSR